MSAKLISEEALGAIAEAVGDKKKDLVAFVNKAIREAADDVEKDAADKIEKLTKAHADEKKRMEESHKKRLTALTEKVNTFLQNLVPRLKKAVEEEIRLSPTALTSEDVVAKIRELVGGGIPKSDISEEIGAAGAGDDTTRELSERVDDLNGRLRRKDKVLTERDAKIEKLNGMLRARDLCEGDPDRDYLLAQLDECKDVGEVEARFDRLKEKLRRDNESDLFEELGGDPEDKGPGPDEADDGGEPEGDAKDKDKPIPTSEQRELARLAGLV